MANKTRKGTSARAKTGNGGETHQNAGGPEQWLTTNQGTPISDNQNSLKSGERGPSLLEDFILREKITHFDHERIPERIVHARGSGAHGYFQPTKSLAKFTKAAFLQDPKKKTEVFVRFSTVAGGAGSVDLPRDVRGFAVKFYTEEGNFDLVGNNIPVFFIQDAIKFPDLIHSVKMEPDRGYPQAGSAHDTFWDFASLMPESMHMLMWAMSDRAIPRSYRMIEGFGVHTFRLVDAKDKSTFVKFHWRPVAGAASVLWDEACKISGADPDFHRRDLFDAIARGDFPEWEFCIQAFDQKTADAFEFDVLDATKLIPEEDIPLEVIGKMVLNRNVDNFFAETEQVAFHPGHVVPGIDFTNDPLLQGRLFSYTDTQLIRLGGPNFHELEINRPRCPMRNFQRDGVKRQNVPTGRVAYEPNSLDPAGPRESAERGFATYAEQESGDKQRIRPESFADHYSQARQFFRSMSEPEQRHIISAFAFELGKVETVAIRKRMLGHLMIIERTLGAAVEEALGMVGEAERLTPARAPIDLDDVARPEPDQEGEADAAGPQGRRADHRRRGRRRARCAPQRGREGRRRVRDRGAEDRRREDRQGQARRGRPRALQRPLDLLRRGRARALGEGGGVARARGRRDRLGARRLRPSQGDRHGGGRRADPREGGGGGGRRRCRSRRPRRGQDLHRSGQASARLGARADAAHAWVSAVVVPDGRGPASGQGAVLTF